MKEGKDGLKWGIEEKMGEKGNEGQGGSTLGIKKRREEGRGREDARRGEE